MPDTKWSEVQDLFHRAFELSAEEVEGFLDQNTDDEDVRAEVLSLLSTAGDKGTTVEDVINNSVPDAEDASEDAGKEFGPYRVVRLLGQGGMGNVYLGERADDEYHQHVAIKVTNRGLFSKEVEARFLIERQILASLSHPNIAHLVDGGTTPDGRSYLVMEYVDGEPIDTYSSRNKLTIRQRLSLFALVCDAVQSAHEKLVIHRDLKPSNTLITHDGQPKLLDFGIAKLLDPQAIEAPSSLTTVGPRPLTPAYASPEQLRGQAMDTSSDVYSLGILLYELLTGIHPTPEDPTDPLRLRSATNEQELQRPSQRLSRSTTGAAALDDAQFSEPAGKRASLLRGELDTILLKTLQFDPERRYGTVAALASDLRNYLEDRPISARRDTWDYRTAKFIRRNRASVAAGVAAIGLLVAFAINSRIMAERLLKERDAVTSEKRRSDSVVQFFTSLFEDTTPSASQGRELTANELLNRGEARLDAMGRDPDILTNLAMTLGLVQLERGDFERSDRLFNRALSQADGEQQLAMVKSNYSRLLHVRGDYDEAAASAREAAAVLETDPAAAPQELAAQLSLAAVLTTQEKYSEARELLQEVIARQGNLGLSAHQLTNDLAQLEHNTGNIDRALELQRLSLRLSREVLEAPH